MKKNCEKIVRSVMKFQKNLEKLENNFTETVQKCKNDEY